MDLGDEREAMPGAAAQVRAERIQGMLATDHHGRLKSPRLRVLRERYDQLAEYESSNGSKLTTLRRLVLFGALAIHVHMIRRCQEVIADGPMPPLLLDLFDGRRRSLREASAASLQGGFRAIEQLVLHRIHEHLQEVTGGKAKEFIASLPEGPEADAIRAEYQAQVAGSKPINALTEAYWKVGYSGVGPEGVRGLPWNSLLALGRRSGYLLPYDNRGRGGKEHKRYGANAEFAEVLVAATVSPGEPVDFDDFLDVLKSSFGIVLGRTVDFEAIRNNDLRVGAPVRRSVSVIESDLRANLIGFRDLINEIGFAKSYADGRTVVTTDEAAA
ncbi:MAG: hypothetical protein H0U53_08630 [Actinobacteria bacterium]|nr:hypothetical protein [Actinomycetota bacterium]